MLHSFIEAFSILDGTRDPSVIKLHEIWLGMKLVETNDDNDDFLHDLIYETYWFWQDMKQNK
ncbi:hypothetical protein [Paenibacillus sp. N3.4]|uniref:hypothetical protein n=1 Tax=Paenibacillus sp. N3.4 TaxID=2603222 RepID=UPI00164EDEB7|nr:hypothetical protein [Paenibacillus sp. N3.4]